MNLDLASIPLIDRPDFESLYERGVFDPYSSYALDMYTNGYCKVSLKSTEFDELCVSAKRQLAEVFAEDLELWRLGKGPPPRLQDGWKTTDEVKQAAVNTLILSVLAKLYGRRPFPFQTLNFPVGSQQAFHSDALHFHCYPHGFMCGVWIALEDVSLDSGPLIYYPGSHRLPYLSAEFLNLSPKDLASQPHPQILFQDEWRRLLSHSKFEKTAFLPKMSEALIWHANLLHGGEVVRSKTATRWSQVTHYYFKGCIYTTPMFSYSCDEGGATLRNPYDISTGSTIYQAPDSSPVKMLRRSASS
jgi:hypothetical protein